MLLAPEPFCQFASYKTANQSCKEEYRRMKKHGICLLPDACYLSELNVPGKPNRTNLGKCAAIQRFLSTHPNENLAILTPYRNQRALLAGTAKKSSYPQEVSLTVHRAQGREWDTCSFSFNEGKRHWDSVIPVPLYLFCLLYTSPSPRD